MSRDSLFSRLATYSQNPKKPAIENFTTEVLAYLINEDHAFRKIFVRHITQDKRLARSFYDSEAVTQQRYPRGIVDLVLCNQQNQKILVEVKIRSTETMTEFEDGDWKPQIRKYLDYGVGPVAYLTTRRVPAPEVGTHRNYLGQFYFEDLYARLDRKTIVRRLFKDFMEDQDMAPPKPFTPKEVRQSTEAFKFARKCVEILDEVKAAIDPEFQRLFKNKSSFQNAHFKPRWQSAYNLARQSRNGAVDCIGLALDTPEKNRLGFCVWLWTRNHPLTNKLRERLHRHLHWESEGRRTMYRYVYDVKGDAKDIPRMVSRALAELRRLRKEIK